MATALPLLIVLSSGLASRALSLIHISPVAAIQIKLTDFGIGQVMSVECLAGVTRAGFTQTVLSGDPSSRSGTPIYLAPELLAGKEASVRSDIYSLGMVFYQLLVGDFARPLTTDWARAIEDPLLRHDLAGCLAGDPRERFSSAAELAKNIRTLGERRAEQAAQEAEQARRERAAYRRGLVRAATAALAIISLVAGLALFARREARRARLSYAQVLVSQARTGRLNGLAGQRFAGLRSILQAAKIEPTLELRNEAISCLALTDIRVAQSWEGYPPDSTALAFDREMGRYARGNDSGAISVRKLAGDSEPIRLPGFGWPVESLSLIHI